MLIVSHFRRSIVSIGSLQLKPRVSSIVNTEPFLQAGLCPISWGRPALGHVVQKICKVTDNVRLGRAVRRRDVLRLERGHIRRGAARPSTGSEIGDPHPIDAVGDCDLGVPVAKVAAEQPQLVLPADMITDAPLRRDARRPGIPIDVGHLFRSKSAGRSD